MTSRPVVMGNNNQEAAGYCGAGGGRGAVSLWRGGLEGRERCLDLSTGSGGATLGSPGHVGCTLVLLKGLRERWGSG